MAVSISISISQGEQSIANNTTEVTAKVIAKWTYGSYNLDNKPGYLKIDGTKYTFSKPFNTGQTTSGSATLFSKKVTVSHASDGTKKVSCSASYTSGVSSGTVTDSASKTLTTIPRKSTLSFVSGTLGEDHTLTINEKDASFKHKITYSCGSYSGYIAGGSSSFTTSNSISWTPPIDLANTNKTGSSASVKVTLYTYKSDGTSVGSNAYTIGYAIPSDIKPTVSCSIKDMNGYITTYGGYIQGLSNLQVKATTAGAYGSTISSCKITADGLTVTGATLEKIISGSGSITISATVTDSRQRTGTYSETITVIPYEKPIITDLRTTRVNSNNSLKVDFTGVYSSVNSKNTATYTLQYKKSTETDYCDPITLSATDVANKSYTFTADSNSSYNITLVLQDKFTSFTKMTTGASAKKQWSFFKKKLGVAIGKVAEIENVFEVGLKTKLTGGLLLDLLASGMDLNNLKTTNAYRLNGDRTYANTPWEQSEEKGSILEVIEQGGLVMQRITEANTTNPLMFVRYYISSKWGAWHNPSYPVGSVYMTDTNTNPSSYLGGTWKLVDKEFATYYKNMGDNGGVTADKSKITTCLITRGGHNLTIQFVVSLTAAYGDSDTTMFNISYAELGVSSINGTYHTVPAYSDGANGFMMATMKKIDTDANNKFCAFMSMDTVPDFASGSNVYGVVNRTLSMAEMADAACDKFYWRRDS